MNKEELLKAYPYRLEIHAHTSPASPCSEIPPEDAVRRYKALGFDGIAITNHYNLLIWPEKHDRDETIRKWYDDYLRAKAEGDRTGMKVYFAMEIRFSENANDYLVYGIDSSFLETAYSFLDGGIDSFYRACKNDRNFIVQAHPFRNGMERANPDSLDGIEVYNMHPNHNSRVGFAEQYARSVGLPITGGTDFHHPGHEGICSIRTRSLPEDGFELADVLRSQDFIFQVGESLILF